MASLLCSLAVSACTRANANDKAQRGADEAKQAESSSKHGNLRRLREEELTPELMRVSERLLEQHANAPIGTEIPFSHGSRRYVARIEQHENANNDPDRPPGKHKGVTLLAPDD